MTKKIYNIRWKGKKKGRRWKWEKLLKNREKKNEKNDEKEDIEQSDIKALW